MTTTTEAAENERRGRNGLTRAEHMAWAKERALKYADRGETGLAMSALIQDLGMHPETEGSVSVVIELMMPLAMMGGASSASLARRFTVSSAAIGNIKQGKNWKHVTEPEKGFN
jgi:hypothetical protein